MSKKTVSGVMLTLLLTSVLAFAFTVQSHRAKLNTIEEHASVGTLPELGEFTGVLYAGTSNLAGVYRYTSDTGWEAMTSVPNSEDVRIETPHPYPDNYVNTWTITRPSAAVMRIHFTYIRIESRYDHIYVKSHDGIIINHYSEEYTDIWSGTVPGNTIHVQFTSDPSINYDGFVIDRLDWSTAQGLGIQEYAVLSLVDYRGHLYAGTMSASNPQEGVGRVHRYDGEGQHVWTMVGDKMGDRVSSLIVFNDRLYAGTSWGSGRLYRYEGESKWTKVVDYTEWSGIRSSYVWNNMLYLGDVADDKIGQYDGTTFQHIASLGGSCIYDFESYNGCLYAGAYQGRLLGSPDGESWSVVSEGLGPHMWELETFQDYLYMSLDSGELQRFDGTTRQTVWTAPDGIISMVACGDRLFIGTGGEAGAFQGSVSGISRIYQFDGVQVNAISDLLGRGGVQVLHLAYACIVVKLKETQGKLYLHVYDSQGRHVGVNYQTNETEMEIPHSQYSDDMNGTITVVLPMEVSNFNVTIDGKYATQAIETYNLTVTFLTSEFMNEANIQSSIPKGFIKEYEVLISNDGEIVVTPEFSGAIILPLFMVATLVAVIIYRKKRSIAPKKGLLHFSQG